MFGRAKRTASGLRCACARVTHVSIHDTREHYFGLDHFLREPMSILIWVQHADGFLYSFVPALARTLDRVRFKSCAEVSNVLSAPVANRQAGRIFRWFVRLWDAEPVPSGAFLYPININPSILCRRLPDSRIQRLDDILPRPSEFVTINFEIERAWVLDLV